MITQMKRVPCIKRGDEFTTLENRSIHTEIEKKGITLTLKPRRTFVDPSLPAALLNQSPERFFHEMQLFGNLFEELCLRDVRVYASAIQQMPEPSIYYYDDADGLEVDIVVELLDGRWGHLRLN
jgi:predicted AAA+ superfamily ATPase